MSGAKVSPGFLALLVFYGNEPVWHLLGSEVFADKVGHRHLALPNRLRVLAQTDTGNNVETIVCSLSSFVDCFFDSRRIPGQTLLNHLAKFFLKLGSIQDFTTGSAGRSDIS